MLILVIEMLSMQGNKLKFTDSGAQSLVRVEVGTPVEINDAANKKYVDTVLAEAKSYTDNAVSGIASDETIQQIQSDINDIKDGTIDLPYIKDSGDTVTGSYDFTGATLNIAEPTSNTNPATKSYVDTKIAGIGEGGEVVAYTNGNGIAISAENVISVNVNATNSNGLGVDANGLKLDLASSTTAGAMSSTDKIKLDAVPTTETVESSISEAINALGIDEVKQDITTLEAAVDNIPVVSASETNGNIKIDETDTTVYTHPTYTEAQEGFYKVTVDEQGHVTTTTAVVKEDITNLGIPAQDTTYTDATTTKSGLMSATDKIALNTAVEDIVDIKEDYVSNGVNNVAKGNPAVCEDSVEWGLQGMRVYGKSTQDGIPSPENPVPIASAGDDGEINVKVIGKNLIDTSVEGKIKVDDGVTWTINTDGSVTIEGTAAGGRSILRLFDKDFNPGIKTLHDGTYTLSLGVDSIPDGVSFLIGHYKGSVYAGNLARLSSSTIEETFSIVDCGILDGYIQVDEGTTVNLTVYPQLEIGSTATPYEPYQSQSLTFQTPNGLLGVKVNADENFTDNTGQKWLCDVRDYAQCIDTHNAFIVYWKNLSWAVIEDFFHTTSAPYPNNSIPLSDWGQMSPYFVQTNPYSDSSDNIFWMFESEICCRASQFTTIENFLTWLDTNDVYSVAQLETPYNTSIPADELAAYNALHTYDGTTIVTSDDDLAYIEFQYITPNQTHLPYIKDSGDIVNGDYTFNGKVNVSQPTENTNVANKEYVDQQVSSAREKQEKLDSYSDAVYTIASMEPNKLYNLRAVNLPDITVTAFAPPEDDNYVSVYHMIFQSNSTSVNLTLPDSVIYPEGFVIETKHIYEINIVDNLLSYQSWPMA